MSHIRIESHERVAKDVKVFYVPGKGEEDVDISNCVNAVDVNLSVGEAVTATLRVFVGGTSVTAEVEEILVNRLKPKSRKPWWRRSREVTTISDRARRWA